MPPVLSSADIALSQELRQIACNAARVGAACALAHFGGKLRVSLKTDRSEVSHADVETQRAIVAAILERRPDDIFFAEEADSEARLPTSADGVPRDELVTWIIDPIDGTRNFVREIRSFACAVAALKNGMPIAAATYDAAHDVLYSADLRGFYIEETRSDPIRDDRHDGYSPRPVVAVPSTFDAPGKRFLVDHVNEIVLRNFGAAALHLAYVAAGKIDASLLCDGCLWDIVGGCLMVEQMGGRITGYGGAPLFPIDLATYSRTAIPCIASLDLALHERMVRVLQ